MEVITERREMSGALAEYARIESAGWKGKRGSAIRIGSAQETFYLRILEGFSNSNGARIFELYFDDVVVSSRLAVIKNGIMIIAKTTYDEKYSKYAPGRLLLRHVLQYAFEQKDVNNVEFYTKATSDQLQWATGSRMIIHHNHYRDSIVKNSLGLVRRIKNWRFRDF
jgi:hypothetical protein